MKGALLRGGAWLLPLLLLASCAGYEAIPWHEEPGQARAIQALGERLAAGLERGVEASDFDVNRLRARDAPAREGEPQPYRVIVAGFPEAGTGRRTEFSRQAEEALRRALGRSKQFRIIDGGEGVAWQEAKA
ncbi:MAG: hypothetical protein AABZ64_01885, partial [Nitrospinota bacterium]